MKGLIGKGKKKRVAKVNPGGDKALEKYCVSIGSKERTKSVNVT